MSATVVAGAVLWSGIALGQTKPGDCKPEKIEGQIVNIDWKQGQEQGEAHRARFRWQELRVQCFDRGVYRFVSGETART